MKISVALLFVVFAVLAGCKKADPMIGTWKLQVDEQKIAKREAPPGLELTAEFKEGGKYTINLSIMDQAQTIEGTYKLDGKTLTMTDTTENGKPAKDTTPQTLTLSDDMKSFGAPKGLGKMVKQE